MHPINDDANRKAAAWINTNWERPFAASVSILLIDETQIRTDFLIAVQGIANILPAVFGGAIKQGKNMLDYKRSGFIGFVGVLFIAAAPLAHAAFVVTLQQVGANVVATGNGTINTAGLTPDPSFFTGQTNEAVIDGADPYLTVGPTTATAVNVYDGISGSASFGSAIATAATSGSGDIVNMYYAARLEVPSGYVSGSALSDTDTWAGQTLSSLGVIPGTYIWGWGSGASADSFTLEVITTPEPASIALLGLGGASVLFRRRRA